jgi:hypothetical protein
MEFQELRCPKMVNSSTRILRVEEITSKGSDTIVVQTHDFEV